MKTLLNEARARLERRQAALVRLGTGERERLELVDIQAALERIHEGRYGRCERCGTAIGRQRLSAIPEARLCMGCSEQQLAR